MLSMIYSTHEFSNIVARFHLDRKIRAKKNDKDFTIYPNNKRGFWAWCNELDSEQTQTLKSLRWIDPALKKAMKHVPCAVEFYRYVQWHNLAFTVTSDLQLPSFVFHYKDYSDRFNEVTDELIDFLGMEKVVGHAPKFIDDKVYSQYYSEEEKHAVAVFVKEFATKATWQQVEHYLNDYLTLSKKKSVILGDASWY
jgi:hypothetical protein